MAQLYKRKYELLFRLNVDGSEKIIDFSQFHFEFNIQAQSQINDGKKLCTIKIWNLSDDTYRKFFNGGTVILGAGYEEFYGQIFEGRIVQFRRGKINGTDVYIEIDCIDGFDITNNGFIAKSIKRGTGVNNRIFMLNEASTQQAKEVINTKIKDDENLRGRVYFGAYKDVMRNIASNSGAIYRVEDNKLKITKIGEIEYQDKIIELNYETGLIGLPETTEQGVNITCLLNPFLKVGTKVKVNANSVQAQKIDYNPLDQSSVYVATQINEDGEYKILQLNHSGDTRGNTWYSYMICNSVDSSSVDNLSQAQVNNIPASQQKTKN